MQAIHQTLVLKKTNELGTEMACMQAIHQTLVLKKTNELGSEMAYVCRLFITLWC
jgi:hypothetical protein